MRKNKYRIITVIIIFLILGFSFFCGDDTSEYLNSESVSNEIYTIQSPDTATAEPIADYEPPKEENIEANTQITNNTAETDIKQPVINKETEPFSVAEQSPELNDNTNDALTCRLSVSCKSVLENYDMLKDSKKEIIPEDGVIFKEKTVEFFTGESVFDVVYREMKSNKIHFEFVKTPMYNSVYIEGIANLYEFDCGNYSGWQYRVNGEKPTYGCSQYTLSNGDEIEIFYSCNLFE